MKGLILVILLVIVGIAGYAVYSGRQSANWNNEAVTLMDEGRHADAAALLEKARDKDPGNVTILKNLAEAYDQAGNTPKAVIIYKEWIAAAPNAPTEARERLAQLERDGDALLRARQRVERMKAEGWKDDSVTLDQTLNTADASWNVGNWKHAITLYERALFKDPTDVSILQRIEEIEQQLKDGKLK